MDVACSSMTLSRGCETRRPWRGAVSGEAMGTRDGESPAKPRATTMQGRRRISVKTDASVDIGRQGQRLHRRERKGAMEASTSRRRSSGSSARLEVSNTLHIASNSMAGVMSMTLRRSSWSLEQVEERGGDLAAGEDEDLGNLGAGDLVHVRRRRPLRDLPHGSTEGGRLIAKIVKVEPIRIYEVAILYRMFNRTKEDLTPKRIVEIVKMPRRGETPTIFELSTYLGPEVGLQLFHDVKDFRIIVCVVRWGGGLSSVERQGGICALLTDVDHAAVSLLQCLIKQKIRTKDQCTKQGLDAMQRLLIMTSTPEEERSDKFCSQ
ncbi:hypothetical protein EJB05_47694, partial [Eragrostis curvula]